MKISKRLYVSSLRIENIMIPPGEGLNENIFELIMLYSCVISGLMPTWRSMDRWKGEGMLRGGGVTLMQ